MCGCCNLHTVRKNIDSEAVYDWCLSNRYTATTNSNSNNNNNVHLSCAHQCSEHSHGHIDLNTIFYVYTCRAQSYQNN